MLKNWFFSDISKIQTLPWLGMGYNGVYFRKENRTYTVIRFENHTGPAFDVYCTVDNRAPFHVCCPMDWAVVERSVNEFDQTNFPQLKRLGER